MAKYKVEIDEGECISCGACQASYEDGFGTREDDQKAVVKTPDTDEIEKYKSAAGDCPTGCIHVYDMGDGTKKAIAGLVGIVLSASILAGSAQAAGSREGYAQNKSKAAYSSPLEKTIDYKLIK